MMGQARGTLGRSAWARGTIDRQTEHPRSAWPQHLRGPGGPRARGPGLLGGPYRGARPERRGGRPHAGRSKAGRRSPPARRAPRSCCAGTPRSSSSRASRSTRAAPGSLGWDTCPTATEAPRPAPGWPLTARGGCTHRTPPSSAGSATSGRLPRAPRPQCQPLAAPVTWVAPGRASSQRATRVTAVLAARGAGPAGLLAGLPRVDRSDTAGLRWPFHLVRLPWWFGATPAGPGLRPGPARGPGGHSGSGPGLPARARARVDGPGAQRISPQAAFPSDVHRHRAGISPVKAPEGILASPAPSEADPRTPGEVRR